MPNRPTYPRIALPPALALRVDALRAGAPTGRPSRQAVVERALAVGLDALEGDGPDADEATVPGVVREVVYGSGVEGPGCPSLKTILFGHEPTPVERARTLVDMLAEQVADLAAQVADLAWVRLGDGEPRRYQCQGCAAERLEWEPGRHVDGCEVQRLLARVGASDASGAPKPAPTPADAPTGPAAPALAPPPPIA